MMRFSLAAPVSGRAEARAAAHAIMCGQISRGHSIQQFERDFASLMGGGEAISVSSGTSAIEVAVRALGLAGEEVITGAMSCQATANALLAAGCRIRFADHSRDTWQVSAESITQAITPRTRALVIAHLYGNSADLPALADLAKRRSLYLIEDCAQCLGATWGGQRAGTFGVASTFSFYGNKIITTGEGGMIWTTDSALANQARLVRNYGQDRPFHHVVFGLNWKMPNVLAALGVEQLKRVPKLLRARRTRAQALRRMLSGNPGILLPHLAPALDPSPFCLPVVLPYADIIAVQDRLAQAGIETRLLFPPQFDQPSWEKVATAVCGEFPVARFLAAYGLYLPVSPHLSLGDCAVIAKELLKIVGKPVSASIEAHAA
jgi:perosamine synthetase